MISLDTAFRLSQERAAVAFIFIPPFPSNLLCVCSAPTGLVALWVPVSPGLPDRQWMVRRGGHTHRHSLDLCPLLTGGDTEAGGRATCPGFLGYYQGDTGFESQSPLFSPVLLSRE